MKRAIGCWLALGGLTLLSAQEWALADLKKRMQTKELRLESMREQVFLRYGDQMGFERADEIPIMDREYERLSQEVARLEQDLAQEREEEARKRQEAELAAAQAAKEARARELARQRAEQEARALAEIEAPFREALGYYRQQQYGEAYDRFIPLYFERDDSVPVGFYTGRSAFETRRYEIAAGAYQQVLSLDPDHRRARLELARTYYVMGMHEEARVEFERVQASDDLPPSVRQNIQAYLDAIEAARKRHHLNGQLVAGLGYDTNVNQGNDYLPEWLQPFTSDPLNPAESDIFLNLVSFNTHRYDMGIPGHWQWESELLLFINRYSDMSENDLLLLGVKTGPLVDLAIGRVRLPVGYDRVWVDGDALLGMTTIAASLERPIGANHFVKGQLRWLDRGNVSSEDSDRDATGYELSGEWQHINSDQDGLITAGALYGEESAKRGDRADVSFSSMALRGGYSWLREGWSAGVDAQLKWVDFSDRFIDVEPVKREDQQLTIGVSGTRSLPSDLVLSGQLSWIDNDSSYAPYDYSKTLLQVNLGWSWGI